MIAELTEDAPATNAGLKVGDIITAANDRAISGSSDLVGFVSECAVGDNVIFTVYRDGESLQISVLIGERPQQVQQEPETEEQQPSNPWGDGENGEGWGFGDGEGGWDFGDGWFGFGDEDGNGGWSFNFGGH